MYSTRRYHLCSNCSTCQQSKAIFSLLLSHTANEGPVSIQYKCLVPILCIPRNEIARHGHFQNRIIMFCLPISTFTYLWAIYIFPGARAVCLFCYSQRGRLMLGIYINRSEVHECRNWERGPRVSFLGIHKSDFRYSASLSLFFSIGGRKNPACIYLIV